MQQIKTLKYKFNTFFYKNQHAASKFYITNASKLVSISSYFFKKILEIWNFLSFNDSVPYVILFRFLLCNSFLSLRDYGVGGLNWG